MTLRVPPLPDTGSPAETLRPVLEQQVIILYMPLKTGGTIQMLLPSPTRNDLVSQPWPWVT